jgi:Phage tail lysozyme
MIHKGIDPKLRTAPIESGLASFVEKPLSVFSQRMQGTRRHARSANQAGASSPSRRPPDPGRGIARVGSRWEMDMLFAFARRSRVSQWALTTQVRFVWHELTTTESFALTSLRRTRNVRSATYEVMDKYERPREEHSKSASIMRDMH